MAYAETHTAKSLKEAELKRLLDVRRRHLIGAQKATDKIQKLKTN